MGARPPPRHAARRRGATGRLAPEQRLRRRAEDALAGAGLPRGDRLELHRAGRRPTGSRSRPRTRAGPACRWRTRCPRATRSCARCCSARCSRRRRHNRARGAEDMRLFEYGAVYLDRAAARPATATPPPRRATRGTRALDPALPLERPHLGALLTGRLRPATWGEPEPPRADFFAAKGSSPRCWAPCGSRGRSSPAREPFLHPGRAARVLVGGDGRRGRLARRAAPGVAAALGPRRRGRRSSSTGALLVAAAPACQRYEDLTSFPAVRQDLAVAVPDDVPAARVRRGRRARRRPAAARRRGVRRLPRRAGRRGPHVARAARSSSARPTGR